MLVEVIRRTSTTVCRLEDFLGYWDPRFPAEEERLMRRCMAQGGLYLRGGPDGFSMRPAPSIPRG